MVPVVVVLCCVLPPGYHPTPGEKFDFLCWSSRSLHRLHSLQSNNFSADSQPASLYYSCSLLFFRTPFAFRQSGILQFDMVQSYFVASVYFGFWILAQEGDGYLDNIKCPPMRLYAQDGCVLKNSHFLRSREFHLYGTYPTWELVLPLLKNSTSK